LRRIQPRKGPAKRSLTLSVASRSHTWRTRHVIAESQGRFRHSHVNKSGFPDPERLPSTSALLYPHYAERSPPPSSRLCHRRAGFQRFFTPRCSRTEKLDPTRCTGSSPVVARTTRRLLTSAIVGGSRAQPARSTKPCIHRQLCPFRSTTSRGFTGQRPVRQSL
jgi:hypothetical protein